MTDMIKELGLGFVLKFTDQTSKEIASARTHVAGMRGDVEGLTRSFGNQVGQIGTHAAAMGTMIKAGFAAAGGAAALLPIKAVLKEALESQRQMRDLTTVMMAQGFPAAAVTSKVAEAQERIHRVNREVPGMLDKMETAAGEMRGAFRDAYLDAFDPIAKLAFVATQSGDFASTMDVVASSLYKFRSSLPGKTDQEKIYAITDALAKAKSYKLDIGETGDILLRASKNASLFGANFYDMLSVIAPIARQTAMPRMAAAAVEQTYEALAAYPDQVKELRKQGRKSGPLTWGDLLGMGGQQEQTMRAKDRWLLDLKITDSSGMLLPLAGIVDQVTKGFQISKQQVEKIDKLVQTGELSPEQVATRGYGIDLESAKLVQKLLGPAFGMLIGRQDEIRQAHSEFVSSAGLTQSIFEHEITEAASQVDLLKGQFVGLKDQLGDNLMPAVNEVSRALNVMAKGLGEWMENNPKTGQAATWIGAGVGTAAAGYVGYRGGKAAVNFARNLVGGAPAAIAETESAATKVLWDKIGSSTYRLVPQPAIPTWGEALTARLASASPSALSTAEQLALLGGAAARVAAGFGLSALIPTESMGAASFSDFGMPIRGTTPPNILGEIYGLNQEPQQLSPMSQAALISRIFGTDLDSALKSKAPAQTVYQTNTVYIDAQGMDAEELRAAFERETRSLAERGQEGIH